MIVDGTVSAGQHGGVAVDLDVEPLQGHEKGDLLGPMWLTAVDGIEIGLPGPDSKTSPQALGRCPGATRAACQRRCRQR
jgi:hypothetical protein